MWRVRSRLQSTEEGFENEAEETDGAWLQRKDEESGAGRQAQGRPLSSKEEEGVTDGVRSLGRKVGRVSTTSPFAYTVLLPTDRHLSQDRCCWMDR